MERRGRNGAASVSVVAHGRCSGVVLAPTKEEEGEVKESGVVHVKPRVMLAEVGGAMAVGRYVEGGGL